MRHTMDFDKDNNLVIKKTLKKPIVHGSPEQRPVRAKHRVVLYKSGQVSPLISNENQHEDTVSESAAD
jgi:hypothetical protein